jgi:hypothetical protein
MNAGGYVQNQNSGMNSFLYCSRNRNSPRALENRTSQKRDRYLLEALFSASGFLATALTAGGGFGVQKSPPVFAHSLGT